MLKAMYNAVWMLILGISLGPVRAQELSFGANTILVYQSVAGEEENQFVLRVGRFQPDIVFEWESESHQGTVHLFKKAVERAKGLTVSGLFEVGVDSESDDVMTKWLSRELLDNLIEKGKTKVKLNRLPVEFRFLEESDFELIVNKNASKVAAIKVEDSRGGIWLFGKDFENPVLLEYRTPFYKEFLSRVSTDGKNSLRWLQRLPPVR
jgi:hypothetical protein